MYGQGIASGIGALMTIGVCIGFSLAVVFAVFRNTRDICHHGRCGYHHSWCNHCVCCGDAHCAHPSIAADGASSPPT